MKIPNGHQTIELPAHQPPVQQQLNLNSDGSIVSDIPRNTEHTPAPPLDVEFVGGPGAVHSSPVGIVRP